MPSHYPSTSSFSRYEIRAGHSSNKSLPILPNVKPDARTPILYNNGFEYGHDQQSKRNSNPKSIQSQLERARIAKEVRAAEIAELERQREELFSEPSIRYVGPSSVPDDDDEEEILSAPSSDYSSQFGDQGPKQSLSSQRRRLREQQDLLTRAQVDLHEHESLSAATFDDFSFSASHQSKNRLYSYPLQIPKEDFVVEKISRAIWPIVDKDPAKMRLIYNDPDLNTTSYWSDDSEDEEETKKSHKRNSSKLFDSWKNRRHSNKKPIAASITTQEQIVNNLSRLQ